MPKDHSNDVGFNSRSFSPYPSRSNPQNGRVELPWIRPSGSRNESPVPQQSVNSIKYLPQLPSFRSSFGEDSLVHSGPHAYAQSAPSHSPPIYLDIDTPSQYPSAHGRTLPYADSTIRGLPPPAAPGTSLPQRKTLLYNPLYPHLPPLPPLPVVPRLDFVATPTDPWDQKNRSRTYPNNSLRRPRISARPMSEAHVSPRLPPHSSGTPVVPDPQHQSSQVLNCVQPVHAVEARETLPPDSSLDIERSSRSLFRNAQNFRTGDWRVNNNINTTTVVTSGKIDGWKILQDHAAPNALHNSSARYDAPKCDEDTRVEVTAEIMGLIKDRAHPQRILCMTGAAGAGKSALQQSIAECCVEENILGGAYFISAADASRNTASTIVPTIAYQLGLKHSTLRCSIAAAVEHDSLIFSQSLKSQMDALVVRPFENLRRSGACDINAFPHVILIDGLDECQGELTDTNGAENSKIVAKRRSGEDRQAELLSALKNSLLKHDLPFRIFIASRPELAIHTALGAGGSLHGLAYHIPLSDKYDATEDMRRYLRRRFEDTGLRINQPHWFTEGDIDTLVRAGSGQFVYVATVYKYVSERGASPVQKLKTVLNWTPEQVTRPFEALDMLYRNILLSAKEAYEAVDTHSGRDFLLLLKTYLLDLANSLAPDWEYGGDRTGSDVVTALLNLESDALEILTLDLRSLVYLEEDTPEARYLAAYHKSLYDFMDEESRAKDLFVPVSPFCTHIAKCSMQHIIESQEPELYTPNLIDWTERSASPSKRCISLAIDCLDNYFSEANIDDEIVDFTHKGGWDKIDTILCKHSGFDIIFGNSESVMYWAEDLVGVAKALKERRPDSEAGEIMRKYAKKWLRIANEHLDDGDATDSSAESDDESSDSDSD